MNENTFTTSRGITVEFCGIAMLLDKLQSAHQPPKPPQYEAKTASGAVEYHDHNETTLETDEDKAKWADYLAQVDAAQKAYNLALTRLVLMRGIKCEMPSDTAWIKQQEFLGIVVPQEETAQRMHWLETEVIGGVVDMERIMLGVMRASGVNEEILSQMAASFRREIQPDAAGQTAATTGNGNVDVLAEIRAGQGGDTSESHDEPVRQSRRKR